MAIVTRDGKFVKNITRAYRWMVTHKNEIYSMRVVMYERDDPQRTRNKAECRLEITLSDTPATLLVENWGNAILALDLAMRFAYRVTVVDNSTGDWRKQSEPLLLEAQAMVAHSAALGKHRLGEWELQESAILQVSCLDCFRTWFLTPRRQHGGSGLTYRPQVERGEYRCHKNWRYKVAAKRLSQRA